MSDSWKKIREKLDSGPVESPHGADWEAMNAKIEAQPDLNKPKRGAGLWLKAGLSVIALLLLTAISVLWLNLPGLGNEGAGAEEPYSEENPAIEEAKRAISSDKQESRSSRPDASQVDKSVITNNNTSNDYEEAPESDKSVEDVNENTARSEEPGEKEIKAPNTTASRKAESKRDLALKDKERSQQTSETSISNNQNITGNTHSSLENADPNAPVKNSGEAFERALEKEVELNNAALFGVLGLGDGRQFLLVDSLELKPDIESGVEEGFNFTQESFRISGVNLGGKLITNFNSGFFGYGTGLDVDFQRGNFLINTGVHYHNLHTEFQGEPRSKWGIKESFEDRYETYEATWVDSIWVIQGPNQGGYVYDTNSVQLTDTITELVKDSTFITIEGKTESRVFSYVEIPVMLGYRFSFERFALDLHGGVFVSKLTKGAVSDQFNQKTDFGLDVALQPTLRYYINHRWSAFGRTGLRYGAISQEFRKHKFYTDFQLGFSLHW